MHITHTHIYSIRTHITMEITANTGFLLLICIHSPRIVYENESGRERERVKPKKDANMMTGLNESN